MAFAGGFPGKKPRTPHPKILKTYVPAVQKEAILGNISALPDIGKLADLYSEQDLARMERAIPGYTQGLTSGQSATNAILGAAQPLLHGEIPQDVQEAIQRSSAYQALSGGYAGSGMSRALTARDLGRTSLDLINQGAALTGQGANTMQAWDALARRGQVNPASMLVTPGQAIAVDQQNRLNVYNALQHSYNVQAQPNPLHNVILSLTEAYLGSMGGGAIGGMGGGGGGGAPAGGTDTSGLYYNPGQTYQSNAPVNFNYTNQYIPQYGPGEYQPGISYDNPFG